MRVDEAVMRPGASLRAAGLTALLLAVALLAAAGMNEAPFPTGALSGNGSASGKADVVRTHRGAVDMADGRTGAPSGSHEVPASLLAAIEKARYAVTSDPGTDVAFEGLKDDLGSPMPEAAFIASNPAQRLGARFTSRGVSLRPEGADASWRSELQLTGLGYGTRLEHPPQATPFAAGNRVELRRGVVTEWYQNERRGIEQGFTLSSPPAREAEGPLMLQIAVGGGLRPLDDGSGGRISFVDRSGKPVLDYEKLYAYDAAGRRLPARMSASGRELRLAVDDRDAAYPLTIDPFIFQAKLQPPPSVAKQDDIFGLRIALSGDTALVGVHPGLVYVFTRSGTIWSLQQKLPAPDGAFAAFVPWVSLDGDTALVGAGGADTVAGAAAGAAYVRALIHL
jgi:hypothetical protein